MDEKNQGMLEKNVPYIVYEAAETRAERRHKLLVIALIIAIVLMFASNAAWLWAWANTIMKARKPSKPFRMETV